jgi:Tyrosine-protein kinase ephrin type A/B receptor-like
MLLRSPRYLLLLAAAEVPPGRFLDFNVVRDCPKGLYQEEYLETTESAASRCLSCPRGWTTASKGTALKNACTGVYFALCILHIQLHGCSSIDAARFYACVHRLFVAFHLELLALAQTFILHAGLYSHI